MIRRFLGITLCTLMLFGLCACAGTSEQNLSSQLTQSSMNNEELKAMTPKLIKPTYETMDSIVAIANVLDYGADPTGKQDSTNAIRFAVLDVVKAGGGTVWIPKGQYLVTSFITVSEHVTIRGDWNDPDAPDFNGDYGTVILAKPQPQELTEVGKFGKIQGGLFQIKSSAGVKGLTVYYPEQDINDVKPYTYTFYFPRTTLSTVENCTVINGYRGIGGTGNDKPTVKNFKGTFLKEGIHYIVSTDIGSFVNVDLNPRYWANAAGQGMKKAAAKDIVAWSKANEGAGMTLHDLEQAQYVNINISGYNKGILFPATPTRFMGSGPIFELYIDDCVYGIYAESGVWDSATGYVKDQWPNLTSIDYRCGYNITKGKIQGDQYSVYNASSEVEVRGQKMKGYVRLSDVKLTGATKGYVFDTPNGKDDLSGYTVDVNRPVKSTGTAFEYVTPGATESQIQAALDKVGKAGGGVVYVPAGNYEIKGYLNVPANTELRGAAGCAHAWATGGTVFFVDIKAASSEMLAQKNPAFINLNGDNAGVTGIYIAYLNNMKLMLEQHEFKYYNYVINGNKHKNVFVYNCAIMGGSRGINFEACDNHVIENVFSHCTFETARVGGKNGLVLDCLANGGYMTLNGGAIQFSASGQAKDYLLNVPYKHFVHINVVDAQDQQLVNFFAFIVKSLVHMENSNNVISVNTCSDGVSEHVYTMNGGSCAVLNAILTSGKDYKNNGCKLRVYNFMSLDSSHKVDVKENIN